MVNETETAFPVQLPLGTDPEPVTLGPFYDYAELCRVLLPHLPPRAGFLLLAGFALVCPETDITVTLSARRRLVPAPHAHPLYATIRAYDNATVPCPVPALVRHWHYAIYAGGTEEIRDTLTNALISTRNVGE